MVLTLNWGPKMIKEIQRKRIKDVENSFDNNLKEKMDDYNKHENCEVKQKVNQKMLECSQFVTEVLLINQKYLLLAILKIGG